MTLSALITLLTSSAFGRGGQLFALEVACAAVFAMCAGARASRADTYYVAPTGSDTNVGTAAKPFKTLAAACKSVPAGKHTIQVAAGVYLETAPCLVPPGVSVIGAGTDKTTLQWPVTVDIEAEPWTLAPDQYLIQVRNSEGASLSGFTIDGKLESTDKLRDRAHGGIFAHQVKNFQIRDVVARSFNYSGIYLSEGTNASVHHCRIEDSGHPHNLSCSGGLLVGDLTDSAIHDNVIRENRGAYGVKSSRLRWGWPKQNLDLARSGGAHVPLVRVKFYGNDIKVRQIGGWGNSQSNMSMELWNCDPTDCEIYDNTFNECVSLTGDFAAPKTVRLHHNRFVLEPGNSYAIEVCTNDLEIDHNYFANGHYPIAQWGGSADRLNIHHNVFDNIESVDLLHFRTSAKDLRFVNNTVYVKNAFPALRISSGEFAGVTFANNLFYKEGETNTADLIRLEENKKTPGVFATIKPGTLTVENNAFFNWTPAGEKAITLTGDPLLARVGRRDSTDFAYFRPLPGSPLIKAGIGAAAPAAAKPTNP